MCKIKCNHHQLITKAYAAEKGLKVASAGFCPRCGADVVDLDLCYVTREAVEDLLEELFLARGIRHLR